MKAYIKLKNSRRFWIPIPLPMFLMRIGLSGYVKNKILSHMDANSRKYVENVDFRALSYSIEDIKSYRGLKLVEVINKDGTEITIIV